MSLLPGVFDPLDDWDAVGNPPGAVPGHLGKIVGKDGSVTQRIIKGTR